MIHPGETPLLIFDNTVPGFVSEFRMQMLGGELFNNNSEAEAAAQAEAEAAAQQAADAAAQQAAQQAAAEAAAQQTSFTNTIVTVDESGFSQACAVSQGGSGCYVPLTAVVNYGDTVTMTNTDPTGVHTFTSGTVDGFSPNPSQIFDSSVLMSGDSFLWQADVSGQVPYYCMLHTWMVGTIVVQGNGPIEETESISVNVSRTSYDPGDSIFISGFIQNLTDYNQSVVLMVVSPEGDIVNLQQVIPDSTGNYSMEFIAGGGMIVSGEYDVRAQYGAQKITDYFVYSGSEEMTPVIPAPVQPEPEPEPVPVSTNVFSVKGAITNYNESPSDVTLRVISPDGVYVIAVDQVTPNANGEFSSQFNVSNWSQDGYHSILVGYNSQEKETRVYVENGMTDGITKKISFVNTIFPESKPVRSNTITTVIGSGTSPSCAATSCYTPSTIIVNAGDTITMKNTDTVMHTFTSGNPGDEVIGTEFNSGMLKPGAYAEWTPMKSGKFNYFDMIHPWMEGTIIVQGSVTEPVQPMPEPEPTPVQLVNLNILWLAQSYDLGDLVSFSISGNNVSGTQKVSVDVTDPRGNTVVSRSVDISEGIHGEIEFRLSENFKTGTYKITATTSDNGMTISEKSYFKLKSQFNSFTISDVMVSDQQGNASTLQSGEMGFIKVNLSSTKSIATLVTVNLFDSELTSIGIGSVQTTLASGESEIILSFMIPEDAAIGPADIYVNAFSDWPSNGGTALTGELASMEDIS